MQNDPQRRDSRRRLLKTTAVLGSAVAAPFAFAGRRPSIRERLNIACVGVRGMGGSDLQQLASSPHANIVALCDVDSGNLGHAAERHGEARTFADWRRMLDTMHKDIDAVSVSTPDHMHAPIALAAMSLGKHVYCQKPIAHNVQECRAMSVSAAKHGVVTQMGTQIHSDAAYRTAVATLRSGVIGKVSEAHLWVSKSWAGPADGRAARTDDVPESLNWDLWLGGAAERPYVKGAYHQASWRGWKDFGCGTLGDMGCHIFDPVFSALGIGAPQRVTSLGPQHHAETFAANSDIRYVFPGTEHTTQTVNMRWTDGNAESGPDADRAQLPDGVSLPGAGSFLVGERGVMVIPHWSAPRFYKDGEVLEVESIDLASRSHYHEWIDACRGEGESSTPFAYSGPLTEAVLVGTIAGNYKGREFNWNSPDMTFGDEAADRYLSRSYRRGWEVADL
jgi:predicted dehydrogenase